MNPLTRVRLWIGIFLVGLILSGVTAFPLVTEIRWVATLPLPDFAADWITHVKAGIEATDRDYPFLFYGTDWLAFAHIVIGLAFIGPWRDPKRNIWIVEWAMLCCVAVIPLALIAGPIRGIPFWWQLVDCSFGVFGIIPLWIVRSQIKKLPEAFIAPLRGGPSPRASARQRRSVLQDVPNPAGLAVARAAGNGKSCGAVADPL